MIVDVRSPVSGYITINGFTVYIEVSEATDNKPYISYWHKDDKDTSQSHREAPEMGLFAFYVPLTP